jgi:hypothetical protein
MATMWNSEVASRQFSVIKSCVSVNCAQYFFSLIPHQYQKTKSILVKEVGDLHTGYKTAPVILSSFLQLVSGVVLGIRDVGEDDLCAEEAISI